MEPFLHRLWYNTNTGAFSANRFSPIVRQWLRPLLFRCRQYRRVRKDWRLFYEKSVKSLFSMTIQTTKEWGKKSGLLRLNHKFNANIRPSKTINENLAEFSKFDITAEGDNSV